MLIQKENIYVHLLSIDKNIQVVVTDDPFISKGDDDVIKSPKDWTNNETKKSSYDLKVNNILTSTLSVKVLYSISHHKTIKAMRDAIQTLYEGIYNGKNYKINMLTEE